MGSLFGGKPQAPAGPTAAEQAREATAARERTERHEAEMARLNAPAKEEKPAPVADDKKLAKESRRDSIRRSRKQGRASTLLSSGNDLDVF